MEKSSMNGVISEIIGNNKKTMEERLIEILDRIEYNEFPIWKKNQINNLLGDIKKSKKKEIKEKIFCELVELLDSN